jgi:hypothetical protein
MRRFVGRCRLSQARVVSDLRRQLAKEAGDRGPDAAGEVSIAGFRGALDTGLGVVDVADNFVVFDIEFHADHKTGFVSARPGELENHARVITGCSGGESRNSPAVIYTTKALKNAQFGA